MKLCPQCESGYSDTELTCPLHGKRLSQTRDLPPGLLVTGAYRIQRKLGAGSMGTVYLVEQESSGAPETLKFLSPELSADEMFTSRFERASKRLAGLHHPNVLATGALQRAEDDSLFFAMEYVDGPTLRTLLNIAPDPFDVSLTLAITRCVAEGLSAAHAAGMIHLDLKPENILVARDSKSLVPKIANFGIGATRENGDTFLAAGKILLTPTYAAPEQWLGTRTENLDGRTDLYALGGILFEMLTGETVFDGVGYHAWAGLHLTAPPRMPSELRPELAGWYGLDGLVLALLAKDIDDRPKDAAAVLALLDAVQFGARILPSPRADFVEEGVSINENREPESVPAAEPAAEPEAAVETTPTLPANLTAPIAEQEPPSKQETPVSSDHTFTSEPAQVVPEAEHAAPEPPLADPIPSATDEVEVEPATAPEPSPDTLPAGFPVEFAAPITEPEADPEAERFYAREFKAPEPEITPEAAEPVPPAEAEQLTIVEAELPPDLPEPEQVEEPVAPEPVQEPVPQEPVEEPVALEAVVEPLAAQELPQLSDPEFPPPDPDLIPPAEVEAVQIIEPELPADSKEPEPVEETVAPVPIEEPVAQERLEEPLASESVEEPLEAPELPQLSDPEFPPPDPALIPPAEAEPAPIIEPELPAESKEPEPVEKPVAQEPLEEPLAPESVQEPLETPELPQLSDTEFPPTVPEPNPPADTEQFSLAEFELPTPVLTPELAEPPVEPQPLEEPVVASEPPLLLDSEFPPTVPVPPPPAETEQFSLAEFELPTPALTPDPAEPPVEPQPLEETVVASEPPLLSGSEFPPTVPVPPPPAETEEFSLAEFELPTPALTPDPTQQPFEPHPLEEPVAASEAPLLLDSGFPPIVPVPPPPAETEQFSLAEFELPTPALALEPAEPPVEPQLLESPVASEKVEEPFVAQELPQVSDPEFPPTLPDPTPPADTEKFSLAEFELPTPILAPEPAETAIEPQPLESPVAASEPPLLVDSEFPPPEPESIPPAEPEPSSIAPPEPPAASTAPELAEPPVEPQPQEEPVVASEPPPLPDPEFPPLEPVAEPLEPEPLPEPVAAWEPPLPEPVFPLPAPESTPPAEAEPAQQENDAFAPIPTAPEPVDEQIEPQPQEEPVAAWEPPLLPDPEFPPLEPVEAPFDPEPLPEPVVAWEPPLPEPVFAPPAPEFIPPAAVQPEPAPPSILPASAWETFEPEPQPEPVRAWEPPLPPISDLPPAKPEPAQPEPHAIEQPFTPQPVPEPFFAWEPPPPPKPQFAAPEPEFIPPPSPAPLPDFPPPFAAPFSAPVRFEKPAVSRTQRFFDSEFPPTQPDRVSPFAPEPPRTFAQAIKKEADAEESPMDIEELKRLFGRMDTAVKPDDASRRTTNTTSIFGQQSTGLGREEWPATAAPTNFFGKPYKPAGPEAPPAQIPDLTAAFARANKADWINTGTTANPSTFEDPVESVSNFVAPTPDPEINFHQQAEEEREGEWEEEEHHDDEPHPLRTVFIVLAAFLLLAGVGFAIWRFVLNDVNEPLTKMNAGCASGDGKACYDLAVWYEQTNTVSDGDERAVAVYSQSCELNFPLACRKLGLKYFLGTGIVRDIPKAIQLYQKGCDKADAESCDNLGNIYQEGKSVPVDNAKAEEFYNKACLAGDDFGCKWATKLATPVSPARPGYKPSPKHTAPAAN